MNEIGSEGQRREGETLGIRGGRPTDPRISIVIPAMNEARNLELVLPTLPSVHEVILVDGASSDDTIAVAMRLLPSVRVVPQMRTGKGNALAAGFEAATGDVIVMFDADGSADAREIPAFIDALVAGADFAKGSRNLADGGSDDITRIRSFGNGVLNVLSNALFRTHFTDLCYGYNAFWRDILATLELPNPDVPGGDGDGMLWGDGFEIETVLNCRVAAARLSVTEVASIERPRVHGVSNLNAVSDGARVLRTLIVERYGVHARVRPHRAQRPKRTVARSDEGRVIDLRSLPVDSHDEAR